ncbi:SdpA family antimicrobial peptide system protein [Streptomyces rishiriensis]|uniref:SdpA family antimicrobial peptide system protein n=1 Tax=Streptomyces rishiriensis TaxID=68264 RepID=UPI0037D6E36A
MKTTLCAFRSAFTRIGEAAFSVSLKSVIIVCAVWKVVIAYVVQEQLPKNVLSLPGQAKVKHAVANMAPQGWSFFTKSPRDPELVPYKKIKGDCKNISITPHASPHNAFGLDRRSRAQGVEIALLLSAAQKDDWRQCQG